MGDFRPGRAPHADLIESNEKINQDVSNVRFQMFFAGLIFAVLSFIAAHPVQIDSIVLKVVEIVALFSLLISGTILLAQLNKAWITFQNPEKITCTIVIKLINFINIHVLGRKKYYWLTFLLGMMLLVIDRSFALLM